MKACVWIDYIGDANDKEFIVDLQDYGYSDAVLHAMGPGELEAVFEEVKTKVLAKIVDSGIYFVVPTEGEIY